MSSPGSLDAESLLRHGAWLAQLARALVARDDEIDDVLQQTYAQALATPPRHETNLRSWLGAIARNVVRSSRRSDAARVAREVHAPRPPLPETPDELVARAELRRAVVDAVLALAEPYRSAVMLRFFEERDVAAISQITKSPEATVRTRIRRGVEQVKEVLQSRVESERPDAGAARALMFVRLQEFANSGGGAGAAAGASGGAATLAAGGIAMSIAAKLALAGAVVVAAGLAVWIVRGTSAKPTSVDAAGQSARPRPLVATEPSQPPSAPPPAVAREVEPIAAEREAASSKSGTTATPAQLATSVTLRGTVVDDATGDPVAGADVWIVAKLSPMSDLDDAASMAREAIDVPERARDRYAPAATASTAGDGFFECSGLSPFSNWRALAFDATGRCAMSSIVRPDDEHPTREVKLRLVRTVVLKGKVTDADSAPIVGASVVVMIRQSRSGAAARVVETQATPEPGAWTTGPIAATLFDVRAEAK
jgi:RNA polymerase sigma factor (sigma-70 family)